MAGRAAAAVCTVARLMRAEPQNKMHRLTWPLPAEGSNILLPKRNAEAASPGTSPSGVCPFLVAAKLPPLLSGSAVYPLLDLVQDCLRLAPSRGLPA